jgi:hypothetical protein
MLPRHAFAENIVAMLSDTVRARSKLGVALHAEYNRHNRRSATSQRTFAKAAAAQTSAIQNVGIH